jgi:hypothetical protein
MQISQLCDYANSPDQGAALTSVSCSVTFPGSSPEWKKPRGQNSRYSIERTLLASSRPLYHQYDNLQGFFRATRRPTSVRAWSGLSLLSKRNSWISAGDNSPSGIDFPNSAASFANESEYNITKIRSAWAFVAFVNSTLISMRPGRVRAGSRWFG